MTYAHIAVLVCMLALGRITSAAGRQLPAGKGPFFAFYAKAWVYHSIKTCSSGEHVGLCSHVPDEPSYSWLPKLQALKAAG